MKRRTYLATATATALTLGGCTGSGGDDDDPTETDGKDDGNGSTNGSDEDSDASTDGTETDETDDDDEADDADDADEDEESDDLGDAVVVPFDDFETLSEWSAAAGSLTADEERSADGAQSALLEAARTEPRVRMVRELDEPIDVTGRNPGVSVATDGPVDLLLQLKDGDSDWISFRQGLSGDLSFQRVNFGIDAIQGDPDPASITEIHVGLWTGREAAGRVWVDDLHFVRRPETGAVMLQFDGGYETAYTEALPILEEHGLPATTFVPTDRIRTDQTDDGDRLTEAQVAELHDAGWTIGSYAANGFKLTHPDSGDPETEIREAKAWLRERGYEAGARFFSYPQGDYDGEVTALVDEHHDLGFAGWYPAQGHATNPALCSQVGDPSAEEAKRMLDLTAELGGITSLTYFRLEETSPEAVAETVDYLAELQAKGDLEVITPADAADRFVA